MKKGILFLLGMLMMVSTAEATDGIPKLRDNSTPGYNRYYKAKPIQFIEKGIKFSIYLNGDFNFDTNTRGNRTTQYVYRNGQRFTTRVPYSRVRIASDRHGRINRIGNVFINYNRFGKVSRVGSVLINYDHRKLVRVGGIQIRYNRYGETQYFGHVKARNLTRNYNRMYHGMILEYNDDYFYNDDFYNNFEDYEEDNDFYYYRSKTGKDSKKGKIIKRKKVEKDTLKERKKRS